jgi:hypothetical protein
MKTWQTTNFIEQQEIKKSAEQFLTAHTDHVARIIQESKPAIAPSGSDLFRPELWKGIHWNWFFETFAVSVPQIKKPSLWERVVARLLPLGQ